MLLKVVVARAVMRRFLFALTDSSILLYLLGVLGLRLNAFL